MGYSIDHVLEELSEKGVTIIDPRQTYISPDVELDRIFSGCELYPGTRLSGARTLIGSKVKIGTEGPAVINDSIIGSNAEVASGFLSEATMLPGSKAGANSHFRAGTLLEEDASTAHSVGLKQTILMYSVTLGSLINFCDVLISGGRSRNEHSEVGSGFIHFNFSPWGKNGNKATPSLIGNVTDGVFLNSERIFLGGLSGITGPVSIGFGALTGAGQVIRESVPGSTIHAEAGRTVDKKMALSDYKLSEKHLEDIREKNVEFISQLYALKCWYSNVRLKRSIALNDSEFSLVLTGAIETIAACISERIYRYNSFAKEWSAPLFNTLDVSSGAPGLSGNVSEPEHTIAGFAPGWEPALAYDVWVKSLPENEVTMLHEWLDSCAAQARRRLC